MARRPIREKEILDPSRILNNLLKDYVDGRLGSQKTLYRAVVTKIDQLGGQFLDQDAPNPKNSLQARVISDALDMHTANEDLAVFWPFFSHDIMPIKEGEHVYVIFEDHDTKRHGLWFSRIPEPGNVDNVNYTDGAKKYEAITQNDSRISDIGLQKAVQDTVVQIEPIVRSPDFVLDDSVTRYNARVGDRVIEGSNNSVIVLGRDRIDEVASGQRDAAGSIDILAGFSGSINFAEDKSRIYISMKTDVDNNLSLSQDYSSVQPGPPVNAAASIILKSDEIRIGARNGIKVVVEGGDIHLEGANIFLGKDAAESLIQGNLFNALWSEILTLVATHVHPSPIPNSPSPTLASLNTPVKNDLSNPSTGPILSQTVKTKA
jgi:hypothetical protein